MKAIFLTTAAALLALSACSGNEGGKADANAAGAVADNAIAEKIDAVKLEPGEWEATQEIVDVQLTGMPKGAPGDAARQMIGQKTSARHCVTPEQAANPGADFLAAQQDAKCTAAKLDMAGGRIAAEMSCEVPQQPGVKMSMAMAGTYLADRYDIAMDVKSSGLANGASMTMKMKTSGKRIGACPPGGAAADDAAG